MRRPTVRHDQDDNLTKALQQQLAILDKQLHVTRNMRNPQPLDAVLEENDGAGEQGGEEKSDEKKAAVVKPIELLPANGSSPSAILMNRAKVRRQCTIYSNNDLASLFESFHHLSSSHTNIQAVINLK
jgi:hypothetical protein